MDKKIIKIIAAVAAAVLVVGIVLALILIKPAGPGEEEGGIKNYTITITTMGEKPFANLELNVYKDSNKMDIVTFGTTDANGTFTFEAEYSKNYVVELVDVPKGYTVDEYYTITSVDCNIALDAKLLSAGDIENFGKNEFITLGKVSADVTVTTVDGKTYSVSELLKSKKAVVLNFWFENCEPCRTEFPYLEAAYQKYSDELEILAINCVDGTDASVQKYKEDNNLSFVVAKADALWAAGYNVGSYPTTVVIDRYGHVGFVHSSSIPDATSFELLFDYFTSDSYEQSTVSKIDDLIEKVEGGNGTLSSPYEEYRTKFEAKVNANSEVYYKMYNVDGMLLEVTGTDAYVLFEGKRYEAVNGKASVILKTASTNDAATFVVGNASKSDKTYNVALSFPEGSEGNPHNMQLGNFTTNVLAGNEKGVYYNYVATQNGTLTLVCSNVTSGVEFAPNKVISLPSNSLKLEISVDRI